jgi:hypothetical protein
VERIIEMKSLLMVLTLGISLTFAEAPGLYGKFVSKVRKNGEILEVIDWSPFPKILDVNMGISSNLKFVGIPNKNGKIVFQFKRKGKTITKKVHIDKNSFVDKSFKFENYYYSQLAGKNGTLTIISLDSAGKEVFKKVVEVRGEEE